MKNHRTCIRWSNLLVVAALIMLMGQSAVAQRRSLNEIDREAFKPGPSPLDGTFETVELTKGAASLPGGAPVISLDGEWQMVEGGEEEQRLKGAWEDAIPAMVPGSVHTALVKAGKIPDPTFGRNDAIARAESFKTWWLKRTFSRPEGFPGGRLKFGGVAIKCRVWLNGQLLGEHEGMFGGPDFEVGHLLKKENTVIVQIFPAPHYRGRPPEPAPLDEQALRGTGLNEGWGTTVVFNNVWGWHYVNIPALGIWRPVRVEGAPAVRMMHPFVSTRDAHAGEIDLVVELDGGSSPVAGRLVGIIAPENFEGGSHKFEQKVSSSEKKTTAKLRMQVPEPRLWWPNNLGDPNLYKMHLAFIPDGGGVADRKEVSFGIRTIEMAPWPEGADPTMWSNRGLFEGFYEWTFVVNGRPMFVKGTGWCTMDPLMDFSRERYERLISLAKDQNIQMFRAWGSGMPETGEFYDLCDRHGIMVMQEWPTAWNSHKWQPYDLLQDTVRRNTLRLRNHPSLVLWGGGNESQDPFGPAIDMMGRYAVELDGTRDFHRGGPWGGSMHSYATDWQRQPLDAALTLEAAFWGEFGMRSMPNYESVQRYLPDDEKNVWPPPKGGSFEHHTPIFNNNDGDMSRLRQFSGYFSEGKTMQDFIWGSQMASVGAVRHTLELARTRWPACTGALYYKMNDNYPAASWASVDWYGAPKISHYFIQQAFAPLKACLLFSTFDVSPAPGRFGSGFNCAWQRRVVEIPDAIEQRPLTFSVWVRLKDFESQNIIMALGPHGPGHWRVRTVPKTGALDVYIPGFGNFPSDVSLKAEHWHHLSFRLLPKGFELYADGRLVLAKQSDRDLKFVNPLVLGGVADEVNGCNGVVDDLVVSTGNRPLEGALPEAAADKDDESLIVLNFDGEDSRQIPELPVYLLDDADALTGRAWKASVRVYNSSLKVEQSESFSGEGAIERVKKLGSVVLDKTGLQSEPLLFVVEVQTEEGTLVDRTFYWTNYEAKKDSLLKLPKTKCSFKASGDSVVITNDGALPAVGVNIQRPGHTDTFTASENYLWLEPGESKTIKVNITEGLKLEGWNL